MNTVKSPTYAFHPQISHTSTVPLSQFNAYTSQYIILFHFSAFFIEQKNLGELNIKTY